MTTRIIGPQAVYDERVRWAHRGIILSRRWARAFLLSRLRRQLRLESGGCHRIAKVRLYGPPADENWNAPRCREPRGGVDKRNGGWL